MRKAAFLVLLGVGLVLTGCTSILNPPEEADSMLSIVRNAAPPLSDPYPLFAGARWVYRNATPDLNPEVHTSTVRVDEILATVRLVDSASSSAWECYLMKSTEYPHATETYYIHRSEDAVVVFDEKLRDPSQVFPGFVLMNLPCRADTYWAYNIPKTQTGEIYWNSVWVAQGSRSGLLVGTDVDGEVVFLRSVFDRETVGVSKSTQTLLGPYTSAFTMAWRCETYDGRDEYPSYLWYLRVPERTWYAPGVGLVKANSSSSVLELSECVLGSEVLNLTQQSTREMYQVEEQGLVVIELRGTVRTDARPVTWALQEMSGLTPDNQRRNVLDPMGEPDFFADIDSAGRELVSGTYVYRFRAAREGYATLVLTRSGQSTDGLPGELSLLIKVGTFNSPPVANRDEFRVAEDSRNNQLGVLENDYDIDPGDSLSLRDICARPLHGKAVVQESHVLYTPDPDYVGEDSLQYTVRDSAGSVTQCLVTIVVDEVNDPPLASDDAFLVLEDSKQNRLDVLTNDSTAPDINEILLIEYAGAPSFGVAEISSDGQHLLYSPSADFSGEDTFVYTTTDGRGGQDTARVTVQVQDVNDPPVATDDEYSLAWAEKEVRLNVLGNDKDVDERDNLRITTILSQPHIGTARHDGAYIYYRFGELPEDDDLTYQVTDQSGATDTATVYIRAYSPESEGH